jgi:beta-lactamase regulating signal transducer with metallopeptidase domain/5-hydroxyisourate hydrolase-like protein (transthyretin family)
MITLLETCGSAIWRASWQAAVLALVVALLLRCCGERLAPRWRYLLWSVVLARLLIVTTPGSSWSAFNLLPGTAAAPAAPSDPHEVAAIIGPAGREISAVGGQSPIQSNVESPSPPIVAAAPETSQPALAPADLSAADSRWTRPVAAGPAGVSLPAVAAGCWLAGCLASGIHLLVALLVLRRRLSASRPVSDPVLLRSLERAATQVGISRSPPLFVTPEEISPCLVGTWRPRLVVPESLVTEHSAARLQHVLAHELAHVRRGDLWTNWLLLSARGLHWFNPIAWWTIREMQAEREAACDELALDTLGETDRPAYAATILELAAGLAPSGISPGMIGLFSSKRRLRGRIERLIHRPAVTTLGAPLAGGLLALLALAGLTDALPAVPRDGASVAGANQPTATAATAPDGAPVAETNSYTLTGRCVDRLDQAPLTGISIRLFKVEGRTAVPIEIAKTVSDEEGRFEFKNLVRPRPGSRTDRLVYQVIGIDDDLPIGVGVEDQRRASDVVVGMGRESTKLSGRVVDPKGRPVAGAAVMSFWLEGRPIPGILSATTRPDGRFVIEKVELYKLRDGRNPGTGYIVIQPDYPMATGESGPLPADIVVTLPEGCTVTGLVNDGVTGKPASGAVVSVRSVENAHEVVATTDTAGRYRLAVPEGRYHVLAEGTDRVCPALLDREFLVGEKVELPPFKLVAGGFIVGQVINTSSNQPVTVTDGGEPIAIGLFGPSQPSGRSISPQRLAFVDSDGRFVLRAAAGENFPYFVNTRGVRMTWDTRSQPAVVVTEGQTTAFNMLITPEKTPQEKMQAARAVVESLSQKPLERTAQILAEFRKLGHTVDETELWCSLMRELVAVGRDAVPAVCAELDKSTADRGIRKLAFALRAIGDPRAVPALIRAIPRTLVPSSSDYGLLVGDKDLTDFMQAHDLSESRGGQYFDVGRPVREVFSALHVLTGQDFVDSELHSVSLGEDPRRQVLQRRIYQRQAQRWQTWWEEHWREFTDDAAYQKVNLAIVDEPLPAAPQTLGPGARFSGGLLHAVLSPAVEENRYAVHFFDLDTGFEPKWPEHIPRDEAHIDWKQLSAWAEKTGVDLMCVTRELPNGTETYVLRTFGVTSREISPRELRNIDRLVAAGTLPKGRPVDELLQHYDDESRQLVLDANGAFLVTTREGSWHLIEVTDRVTRTANLTGLPSAPAGVGFHKGVRFNWKGIIP